MAIDISAWKKLPTGLLELHTVLGYQAIPLEDNQVGLRIEYVTSQAHLNEVRRKTREPSALQVRLSMPQAEQMLGAVRHIAESMKLVAGPKH